MLGLLLGFAVLLWSYLLGRNPQVSMAVSVTLIAVATLATFVGSAMPFVFRLVKIDPALVSAPLITTVMDIARVLLYFLIARMILLG